MLRINLLPYKEATLVQWGQRQVLLYVGAVLLSLIACFLIYRQLPDPEATKRMLEKERKGFEAEIQQIQATPAVCDQVALEKKIKREQRKYRAVERLITQRRTPKYVLRELSRILSETWGPTLKPGLDGKDKRTHYNPNWDPTKVWITSYEETGRQVKIEGGALASDDVAEFWRRLQASVYFKGADLEKFSEVGASKGGKSSLRHLKFSIVARVSY